MHLYDDIHEGFGAGIFDGLRLVLAIPVGLIIPWLLFQPWFWAIAIPAFIIWLISGGGEPKPEPEPVRRWSRPVDWDAIGKVLDELTEENFARLRAERDAVPADLAEDAPNVTDVTGVPGAPSTYSRSVGAQDSAPDSAVRWDGWVWRER
jgi:hypothetical protein